MRHLWLLLLLLVVTGTLSAQDVVIERVVGEEYTTITKVLPKRARKHDFRFSVGTYMGGNRQYLHQDCWGSDCASDFRGQVSAADTYLTDRLHWGAYSPSYVYHARRWFQFGGTVTFAATTQSRRDVVTDVKLENLNMYSVAVMPTVRFVYLYRNKVQLYSALSLGINFGSTMPLPCADMTILGCTFGSKLFGFAEFGTGVGGWGRVGIGYRLDAKKREKK